MNDKYNKDDHYLGGQIDYANDYMGTDINGFESTDFGFEGTGCEYVLYMYLKTGFNMNDGPDPFFSDELKFFGIAKTEENMHFAKESFGNVIRIIFAMPV